MNEMTGLLRGLQPDVGAAIGGVIAILVLWTIVKWFIGKVAGDAPHSDVQYANGVVRTVALFLCFLVVGAAALHSMSYTVSVRIPRADVNGGPVYQDMDRLIKK